MEKCSWDGALPNLILPLATGNPETSAGDAGSCARVGHVRGTQRHLLGVRAAGAHGACAPRGVGDGKCGACFV